MRMHIRAMPVRKVWRTIAFIPLICEKSAGKGVGDHHVIALKERHMMIYKFPEHEGSDSEFLQSYMVKDGEFIPKQSVCDSVDLNRIHIWSIRRVTHRTSERCITRMNALSIHPALSAVQKAFDTIVDGIEKSLPVKGTAFKYDCYAFHFLRTNHVLIFSNALYALMENDGFLIL